jgi:AsmA protein
MPASQPKSFFPLPEAPRMPRRRPNALARVVSTLGIAGVLVLLGAGIALWNFDLNDYKPRIEAAIGAATGRKFTIRGELSVVSWFTPTVSVTDLVLANPPGAARPDMLTIPRVEADLGLRALLAGRLDIARLVFFAPELRLETSPAGVPNWRFTPAPPSAGAAPPVILRALHVKDGKVSWRDTRTGAPASLDIRRLSATRSDDGSATAWNGDLQLPSGSVEIAGQTGSLVRLLRPGDTTPWRVHLLATLPGARFTLSGALRQPWRPAGYDLTLDGTLDDASALAALAGFAGYHLPVLPRLHRIGVTARLSDASGAPALVSGRLGIGPSDFSVLVPGLQIDDAELDAAAGRPARLSLRGTLRDIPLAAGFTLGTLAELAALRLPVDGGLTLGESRVDARGTLGDPRTGSGADLLLTGRIRDLAKFSPLARHRLPPLQDITASARLLAAAGGWRGGIRVPAFSVALPQGDLAGTLDLALGDKASGDVAIGARRPAITLRLRGAKLDLDALSAALGDYQLLPLADAPPVAALPFARTVRPLIPDDRLGLAGFGLADADVTLDYGELDLAGLALKDLSATITLKRGRLAIGPARAQLAGGPVELHASLDSAAPTPPVTLTLHAPALSVRPLLESIGSVKDITGTLAVDIRLAAAGRSPHAWAASATGHVAAGIVDGTIDNAILVPPFAGVLRVAHLSPDLLFGPGRSRLRCFALRLDSTAGKARLASLLLDADRALVQADGTVDFADEAMNIRLRPTLRIGGPGLVVPLLLRGSLRSPVLTLDQAAVTGDVARALADAAAGRPIPGPAALPSDDQCTAALAVVRGDAGGPVPGAAPTPPPMPKRAPRR